MKQPSVRTRPVLLAGVAGLLLLVALLPSPALALPPRPAPQPTPVPLHGGFIELQLETGQTTLWTVVQWQDALGGWHDVAGWQGAPDADGKKTWWVAETDLGKGPFRWVIFQESEQIAASEPFHLPHSVGETVRLSLPPTP